MSGNLPPQWAVQANGQGNVSDGNLNSFVQGGGLLANARQFPGVANMMISLIGLASPGDGGQGDFYWNDSSTATDDGGSSVIQPNGILTGRWLRLPPKVTTDCANVVSFGADPTGVADSTAAFVAAWASSPAICVPVGTFKISSAITIPVNGSLTGAGPGALIVPTTTGQACFTFSLSAPGPAHILLQNFSISSPAANVVGMSFTLAEYVTIQNVTFSGCQQSVVADRGSYYTMLGCNATGNSSFQPGVVQFWSSNETEFINFVTISNFQLITNDSTGAPGPSGASGPGIYLRRCLAAFISECSGDNLSNPATHFIVLEDDCVNCKILQCYCHGAENGILIQPGGGSTYCPAFTTIIDFSADAIQFAGIGVGASAGAPCEFLTIIGGALTTPQASGASALNISNCSFLTVSDVDMSAGSVQTGTAMNLSNVAFSNVSGCQVNGWFVGIALFGNNSIQITENTVAACATPLTGSIASPGNNAIRNNPGINPFFIPSPAVPAPSTPVVNNLGADCLVCINGGSNVNVYVNNTSTNLPVGAFLVEAGNSIELTYTAPPLWTWIGL